MNVHNIPQDKKQAQIHLTAIKQTLLELMTEFGCKYTTVSNVCGTLHSELEQVNNLLEGAEYEESANLDHMTENQFNV